MTATLVSHDASARRTVIEWLDFVPEYEVTDRLDLLADAIETLDSEGLTPSDLKTAAEEATGERDEKDSALGEALDLLREAREVIEALHRPTPAAREWLKAAAEFEAEVNPK